MSIIKKILGIKDISKEFEMIHVPSPKRKSVTKDNPPVSEVPKAIYQKYTEPKLTKEDEAVYNDILKMKKSGSTKQDLIKIVRSSKMNNPKRVLELVEMVFSKK